MTLTELINEAEELGITAQLRAARLALGAPADVIRQFWATIGLE